MIAAMIATSSVGCMSTPSIRNRPDGRRNCARRPGYVSRMTAIQTVLFDLDGTLDRFGPPDPRQLPPHPRGPRPAAADRRGLAPGRRHAAHACSSPSGATTAGTLEALIATYREYNLANHDRMVTVYPGVVAAVEAIRAAGRAHRPGDQQEPAGRAARADAGQARSDDGRAGVRRRGDQSQARIPSRWRRPWRCSARTRPRRSTWATASTTWCRAARRASAPRPRSGDRSAASPPGGRDARLLARDARGPAGADPSLSCGLARR